MNVTTRPAVAAPSAMTLPGGLALPPGTNQPERLTARAFLRSTPGRIALSGAATLAAGLLCLSVSLGTIAEIRSAVRTIGSDTAPSVVLAERMVTALGDMDSNATNGALVSDRRGNKAWQDYETSRGELAQLMTEANANVTFGEFEKAPLRELRDHLDTYYGLLGEARGLQALNPGLAHTKSIWASNWMRAHLIPAAERLGKANSGPLEAGFAAYSRSSLLSIDAVMGATALLLVILAVSQVWLARRTGRRLNPGLAAATLLVTATAGWFSFAVMQERRDLYVAKDEAFTSMQALYRTRSLLYAMNADVSLWLLDRHETPRRTAHEASYRTRLAQVADLPWNAPKLPVNGSAATAIERTVNAAKAALAAEMAGDPHRATALTPRFDGQLGTMLRNVNFGAAEREPITAAFEALRLYADIDGRIRAFDGMGHTDLAINLCLGRESGESYWAFAKADQALKRALEVNEREFDARIHSAVSALDWMPGIICVSLAASLALAALGLWARYREFG